MNKWQQVKLGELYDVHNGLSKSRDAFGTGYPFLSFSEVFNNYFLPNKLEQLVESTQKEQDSYSIHRGDVFITRTSETMDELGMSCVALHDYPNATYNGFTKRLRPKYPDRVLPEYIGYFLRTPLFRSKFVAFSTMTTRASLRNEDLLTMEVTLPPIEIQRKIADVLSAYDDLIENNRKQIKLLEEAAQRLYKEWFIDLRFPGHETTPIIDGIPNGWENANLESLGTFTRGKTITKDQTCLGNIPVVAGGMTPAYYHNASNTDAPVITVSGSGANAGFANIYFQNIWASDCSYLEKSKSNGFFFIYCFLKSNQEILDNLQKGSAQPHVYAKDINAIKFCKPDKNIVDNFEHIVLSFFDKIEQLQSSIRFTIETRDRLLPKLMSGEII